MRGVAAIEGFLDFKRDNRGRALRTLQSYRHALERLIEYLGDKDPLSVAREDLLAFTGPWLAKRGIVAASRRPYIAAVRQFYRWAYAERLINHDPAIGVPYPKAPQHLPRMMSLANMEKLLWQPDFNTFQGVRDGAMMAILVGCGLRVSGLVALNEANVIQQLIDERPRLFLRVLEKGDKERLVPVPPEADLLLRVYLEHPYLKEIDRTLKNGDKVLFINVRVRGIKPQEHRGERRRMTRGSVHDMIQRYGRAVGIPDDQLHPHAMRHLYGTELAESDVDQLVRQQLMGHTDPKSTKIYTHLATRKLVGEVDRANPLGKMRTPTTDILQRLKS